MFNANGRFLGGYSFRDGTVEFYGRVSALLRPQDTVLDIGAGRGAWFHEDRSDYRRSVRTLMGKCATYVGADVDAAVLSNPTTDRNCLIEDGRIPDGDATYDVVIADYVLEHVDNVASFKAEVERLLKPGGYFCARTPHKLHYVSTVARLVNNSRHQRWLASVQPERRPQDVFPTAYKLNTRATIKSAFNGWEDYSYLFPTDPAYYWGRRWAYEALAVAHKVLPGVFTGNLFVFLRKPI